MSLFNSLQSVLFTCKLMFIYFNSYLFCHQFAICRRDRSKVAPSAFFEEKEQETFASKENPFILILHLAFKILANNFNSYISY